MESSEESYIGDFLHTRDGKGRLTVPSKWRYNGDELISYMAIPDPLGCITVLPPVIKADFKDKLRKVSMGDLDARAVMMKILAESDEFQIDKTGRIKIKDALYHSVGIDKEVLCIGGLDRFHLWEPERYRQCLTERVSASSQAAVIKQAGW